MEYDSKEACLNVLRYNPCVDKDPHFEKYFVPITEEKMNLLQALEYIYQEQDSTLTFRRYCCGLQFCNSCRMLINDRPAHACLFIVEPGTEVTVAPLARRQVLRDLIVEEK